MADIGDLVLKQWTLAMRQASGDGEGAASILSTAVAFCAAEAGLSLEDVISRVQDDYATAKSAMKMQSS